MPRGVEVQVLSSAQSPTFKIPCRLMVGQQPLELFIVVRIHAGQQILQILPGLLVPEGRRMVGVV